MHCIYLGTFNFTNKDLIFIVGDPLLDTSGTRYIQYLPIFKKYFQWRSSTHEQLLAESGARYSVLSS